MMATVAEILAEMREINQTQLFQRIRAFAKDPALDLACADDCPVDMNDTDTSIHELLEHTDFSVYRIELARMLELSINTAPTAQEFLDVLWYPKWAIVLDFPFTETNIFDKVYELDCERAFARLDVVIAALGVSADADERCDAVPATIGDDGESHVPPIYMYHLAVMNNFRMFAAAVLTYVNIPQESYKDTDVNCKELFHAFHVVIAAKDEDGGFMCETDCALKHVKFIRTALLAI